jgi:hypothetical protein
MDCSAVATVPGVLDFSSDCSASAVYAFSMLAIIIIVPPPRGPVEKGETPARPLTGDAA